MATTEHKEGKATVKVVYWTWKTLPDGSHPFILQITKDRKMKRIATGESLHPAYWNGLKSNGKVLGYEANISPPTKKLVKITGETFDREKLIAALKRWEAKYKAAAKELADADEEHNAKVVAAKAIAGRSAQRRVKLLAYCYELSAGYLKAGQTGNATIYRDLANQLAKFVASESGAPDPPKGRGKGEELEKWVGRYDIPLTAVTLDFCQEWENTLRATGVREITLSLRFRTLRAVLNKAIADKDIKLNPATYPFSRTGNETEKFKVGGFNLKTAKRAISREELRQLEALEPATERQQLAKDVFLFSYYCSGLNFVDLGQLRWQDLEEQADARRLNYTRQKTGGKFSLKLLAPAAAIVAKYQNLTKAGPDSYIFPILDTAKHVAPQQVKNRLHKVLGQVNSDLKELGELAGISTPLTTYVARHTFATVLKRAGTSTAVISEAMGHSSEAVTAIYLGSFEPEVMDNALEAIL